MTDITELALIKGQKVEAPYYLVECDCGKIYPSSELSGGEPMGDSGDYSDCYCPHCGEGEEHFAECADPETAWKAQQDKIDALVEALEKAQAQSSRWLEAYHKAVSIGARYEERIAELESRTVKLPKLKMLEDYLAEVAIEERKQILVGVKLEFHRALAAAGIKVEAE